MYKYDPLKWTPYLIRVTSFLTIDPNIDQDFHAIHGFIVGDIISACTSRLWNQTLKGDLIADFNLLLLTESKNKSKFLLL